MLSGARTVADVGCDHGRLSAALLQQNVCQKVVAADISRPSLKKAEQLLTYIGVADRASFRLGDGLSVIKQNECDAIAMLGMGGTLMVRILEQCEIPLNGAEAIVLQPMRAQADIREYLYRNNYAITDDRILTEHGRFYQVLRAVPGNNQQKLPDGFPKDFFDVGYRSFADCDPNLIALCTQQLMQHQKRLRTAQGTDGEERFKKRIDALQQIMKLHTETKK